MDRKTLFATSAVVVAVGAAIGALTPDANAREKVITTRLLGDSAMMVAKHIYFPADGGNLVRVEVCAAPQYEDGGYADPVCRSSNVIAAGKRLNSDLAADLQLWQDQEGYTP